MEKISLALVITAFLLTAWPPHVNTQVLEIIQTSASVMGSFAKVWKFLDDRFDLPEVPLQFFESTSRKVAKQFNDVRARLDVMERNIESAVAIGTGAVLNSLDKLPAAVKFELRMERLEDLITRVNVLYERTKNYSNFSQFEKTTLENFATMVVSHDSDSLTEVAGRIHVFVTSGSPLPSPGGFSGNDVGIFESVAKSIRELRYKCELFQSPQQIIYHLYYAIALAEFRSYVMMQFSYMLLKLYQHGNFATEAQLINEEYAARREETLQLAKLSMQEVSREIWRCDPKNHVEGETYTKIAYFMQGYLVNENELSKKNTCSDTCTDYQFINAHDLRQVDCRGKLFNCISINKDVSTCKADESSGRRYEYIKYKSENKVLGREKQCSKRIEKFESWTRGFVRCSLCMCFCDENRLRTIKYFNMRNAFADIKNNYVVTGLKFVVHKQIIHLQIQQGKLMPSGRINVTTVHWKPVEDYDITTRKIYPNQDFYIVDWKTHSVDLDNLIVDKDHLITGIRFRKLGSHLNLEAYVSPFDFSEGQLTEPETKSFFYSNFNTIDRTELNLQDLDVPTLSTEPSVPISTANQYINFLHSSVDLDAAQSTVPFLDIQPVLSMVPTPLSGVGIYLKGSDGYGGFLAPKIFTYDFSEHFTTTNVLKNENIH